jgi:hypothetical protein
MVYQTPFQAEDENDAEELDRIEQDSVDEGDTEDLSARAKGSALDFSSFADPVPSSKAAPARGGKPTALDFSGQADEITVPASPPLPRARPAQAAQPDLFAGQDVPLPRARPDSAPALESAPYPRRAPTSARTRPGPAMWANSTTPADSATATAPRRECSRARKPTANTRPRSPPPSRQSVRRRRG